MSRRTVFVSGLETTLRTCDHCDLTINVDADEYVPPPCYHCTYQICDLSRCPCICHDQDARTFGQLWDEGVAAGASMDDLQRAASGGIPAWRLKGFRQQGP